MRIFKTRALAKFTRQNGIRDASLVAAIDNAMRGLIELTLAATSSSNESQDLGKGKEVAFEC
jgi:hypothetical protein